MNIKYELMTQSDCHAVAQLLQSNSESQQGGLLGEYPQAKVNAMFAGSLTTIIGRDGNKIVAVVFSFDSHSLSLPPIAHFIIKQHTNIIQGNWLYGPVCIDNAHRGKNILKTLFDEICSYNQGKPVAFINADNLRSLFAHKKIGMSNVTDFEFDGTTYHLMVGN
ncbi:N-acetyltransferase [Providencia huaxiensis]|uniref:N-acetyltransferase n=1 Tax=Providencia huaxiensis TaxID=2027290 RepID=A0A345LSW7_9GAMM|nr:MULTISPECIES: N-acetyltransferase [Providencia]AXH61207.1 N-acetyltransferase [Providencia huaxiensis]MBN6361408.1 N-acetyltransferase [Providencia huaxiensis]MBQ0267218.1 N-acetyltransferase [Providencia huaxiensis]MBZ3680784.1 N-acetyltransferase [Providencia rettgeri]MCD2527242.1 N-acetyltransferase [Providencia huaxiensis]